MTDTFPPLTIEQLPDGSLRLEDPTDTSSGYTVIIDLHPAQVRVMAERLGLIVQSGTECPIGKSSAELKRDNDRHRRNLLHIRERAMHLQSDFAKHADWDHADLLHEMTLINGVVDLLDLACDGFSPSLTTVDSEPVAERSPATPASPLPKPSAKASAQLEIEA